MDIEVIKFFPIKRDDDRQRLNGSITVNLKDIGVRILGISVEKRKDSWYFSVPYAFGIHHETGETCRYPIFVFEDKEKNNEFISILREKGKLFVENFLLEFPQVKEVQEEKEIVKTIEDKPKPKKKVYVDMPRRNK